MLETGSISTPANSDPVADVLGKAASFYHQGDLQAAEHCLLTLLANSPNVANAWDLRAAVVLKMGKLEKSIEYLRHAIAVSPQTARFHVQLGAVLGAKGQFHEALAHLRHAIQLEPNSAEAFFCLGKLHGEMGDIAVAVAWVQRSIELQPSFFDAHFYLGMLLQKHHRLDESIACLRRAVELMPQSAQAMYGLAVSNHLRGNFNEAIACYQKAIQLAPSLEDAHLNLGNVLAEMGRSSDAIECLEQARARFPNSCPLLNNLGHLLRTHGRTSEAVKCLQHAIGIQPDAYAFNNLGIALNDLGKLDDAVDAFRESLKLMPDFAGARSNLGNVLKDQGLLDEAIEEYRSALRIEPRWMEVHSNLLCTLNPHAGWTPEQILGEHRAWDEIHAKPLRKQTLPHTNDLRTDRPLRIGYVTPDLKGAPVGRFMRPVYRAHHRDEFLIYTYSSVKNADAITEACREHSTVWRNVLGVSDGQLAEIIRQDKIDILIDLTMHMIDHRLLVFARKPAPVQATYLAYGGTTGLSTMDFRITDRLLDPPEQNDFGYVEQSIRLPGCYWCYEPVDGMPEVRHRPSGGTGQVTFGCLNNFCKVTQPALDAWSQILARVPKSRLLLHAQPGSHRRRVLNYFAMQGIAENRIEFAPALPGDLYFVQYHRIDIALDTFPFCGGTTTCDALWMGVPVVSLSGARAVNRSGLSLLTHIGLEELVVHRKEDYVQLAVELASNFERLSRLSASMRDRMQQSTLMDAEGFARGLESTFRSMWTQTVADLSS
ncbi:MAG: tetratricopeptide repeat protein [Pirellula sp.]